jgi:uncharacterized protein with HEPN domain
VIDDRLYLIHIRECIDRIRRYTAAGRNLFLADSMIQDAVLRNLQVLAESTLHLSQALRDSQPQIDWRSIRGFRNVVVHDYLGLDMARVWEAVANDLDTLRAAVEVLLAQLGEVRPGDPNGT